MAVSFCFREMLLWRLSSSWDATHRIAKIDDVAQGEMILDHGPETFAAASVFLQDCATIVWNGPMGAFEIPPFDAATNALAKIVAAKLKTMV